MGMMLVGRRGRIWHPFGEVELANGIHCLESGFIFPFILHVWIGNKCNLAAYMIP
jgi:hypothetical protein